jgi:hypothetical protein
VAFKAVMYVDFGGKKAERVKQGMQNLKDLSSFNKVDCGVKYNRCGHNER